jgi:hypothetical protein
VGKSSPLLRHEGPPAESRPLRWPRVFRWACSLGLERCRFARFATGTDPPLVETDSDPGGGKVSLCVDAFIPKEGAAEMLQLFADNVGDHLASAAHNLSGTNAPMLEQSVFANSLRPESVAAMNTLARQLWSSAFHDIVRDATALSDQDRGQSGADQRVRIGMYFYHGPDVKA